MQCNFTCAVLLAESIKISGENDSDASVDKISSEIKL